MSPLAILAVLAAGITGCASPAYSDKELSRQISRNMAWDAKQMRDDVDHILLLRPMGHLTYWELR